MNKTTFLTIGIVILLLLNAVTLFILYRMHVNEMHRPDKGEGPAKYIIDQLGLDAKQQQQFADLRDLHQDSMLKIHDEERRLHDQYFSLLKSNNPDINQVDSIASLMAQNQKRIELITFMHFQQLRAICRDDQKKRFDNTIDDIAKLVGQPGPEGGGPPRAGPPRR
jgi:protein CpxP